MEWAAPLQGKHCSLRKTRKHAIYQPDVVGELRLCHRVAPEFLAHTPQEYLDFPRLRLFFLAPTRR